ncbi:MAG: hypothetical protein G01um101430_758 [Parcubacteria group bacterium Gr01-1014_30]|nr:MAG: hypothetical protein G01um101430_758 [Parcubacteria group bacterium Gr01-1014_30]
MKIFYTFGFIFTFVLLALYVFQVNAMILETFQVQSYQKKAEELAENNRSLEVKVTKVSYLENLERRSQELGFERVGLVNYIQIAKDSLAAKSP